MFRGSLKIKIIHKWVQIISPCRQWLARCHVTIQRCSAAPALKLSGTEKLLPSHRLTPSYCYCYWHCYYYYYYYYYYQQSFDCHRQQSQNVCKIIYLRTDVDGGVVKRRMIDPSVIGTSQWRCTDTRQSSVSFATSPQYFSQHSSKCRHAALLTVTARDLLTYLHLEQEMTLILESKGGWLKEGVIGWQCFDWRTFDSLDKSQNFSQWRNSRQSSHKQHEDITIQQRR